MAVEHLKKRTMDYFDGHLEKVRQKYNKAFSADRNVLRVSRWTEILFHMIELMEARDRIELDNTQENRDAFFRKMKFVVNELDEADKQFQAQEKGKFEPEPGRKLIGGHGI